MKHETDNFFKFFKIVWFLSFILAIGIVTAIVVLLFIATSKFAEASELDVIVDEPIIITEFHGRNDSIVTGVSGDNAINLYRSHGPRGGQTVGVVGDQVILINHLPNRHYSSSEESIRNPTDPSPNRRDE